MGHSTKLTRRGFIQYGAGIAADESNNPPPLQWVKEDLQNLRRLLKTV